MFKSRIKAVLITSLFLSLVAASFAPTAAAQKEPVQLTMKLDSQTSTQELKPLQGSIELKGSVNFVSQGNARTSLTGVTVSYTVANKPGWANVIVSPATEIITFTGTGAAVSETKTFSVYVTATADAPAFTPADIEISATTGSTQTFESATAKAKAEIRASYYSILDVIVGEPIKVERPQTTTTFPLKVTNYGNGPTKVEFEILNAPEGTNLQVLAPSPLQLQAKQTGGTVISQDIGITVQTPYKNGYMNVPSGFQVKVSGCYALDCKLTGDTTTVHLLVTTRGFYVPGPAPLLMVGVLVALAGLLRRRD